ncbi:MAG: hypothetical protein M3N41_08015 [Acidobacteriota bacterium]|nr:hypothetical protein [Acidobacteriota bacterium]
MNRGGDECLRIAPPVLWIIFLMIQPPLARRILLLVGAVLASRLRPDVQFEDAVVSHAH